MQSNKNIKGRAIFSQQEDIKEKSLKLYMYLVAHANLRNAPNKFGDNVRIFQQRDIVLTKIKKILNMDERTIKKYWEELEKSDLIRFCPHGWKEVFFDEKKNPVSFNDRWKIRNKHKETYYEIPVLEGMLFRKIPKQTIVQLNEYYCVKELTLKVYMTLVNYQEDCITNGYTYKRFTYQDLRDMLGYAQENAINKKLEGALNELIGFNLISLEKGDFVNEYGLKIPVFILNQVNFYIDFEIMNFETANENVVSAEQIMRVKNKTEEDEKELKNKA